ncbi:hypothetical protein M422DRAFT_172000 [Sphaerobolus stellatus SS14]|uniref:Cytochrome P450 n=1 Tax=Sphaerobolus stellatus (strain SS14) TaxID=990650 RepID=A0A0C9VU52_SPHS4|nr:hypothetical protein M422DRAFT_172000 [Sphaerobolus stellatus SS14]
MESIYSVPKAAIPAVGPTNPIAAYIAAFKASSNTQKMIEAGLQKYDVFRIPLLTRWHIVLSGKRYAEEIKNVQEEVLSFKEAMEEIIDTQYLIGSAAAVTRNASQIDFLARQLGPNLSEMFEALKEEVTLSSAKYIPLSEDWTSIPAYSTIVRMVSQLANCMIVGSPLCRDEGYLDLVTLFLSKYIEARRRKVAYTPAILKGFVARNFTPIPNMVNKTAEYLRPIVEGQQKKSAHSSNDIGDDRSQTFVTWLYQELDAPERTPLRLAQRVLSMNFASIHNSAAVFTNVLYELAHEPHYFLALREEIETMVEYHGWTRDAILHMEKLDSCFKESQRMNVLGSISMNRLAMEDYSLSDGTRIPKGAFISVELLAPHQNAAIYPNPGEFRPFRFVKGAENGNANQFAFPNKDYLPFGIGKHACPGRFFASLMLKTLMAHIILTYDIKFEDDGVKSSPHWYGTFRLPNTKAVLQFRRRK